LVHWADPESIWLTTPSELVKADALTAWWLVIAGGFVEVAAMIDPVLEFGATRGAVRPSLPLRRKVTEISILMIECTLIPGH
jgi:hypothetical protein